MKVSEALNAKTEIDLSKNYQNLRLFTVDQFASAQPLNDFTKVTSWSVCSPETVKDFSATAYFFGREVSKELKDVKIGLVDASWGGTVCEAWASRAAMEKVTALAPLLKHSDENDEPTSPNRAANLYNGMIAPMTDFPIRGVIWYQGEANNGRGAQYATLFPTLIADWRQQFGSDDLPFYFVQLAPYRYKLESPESLAELRDAQLNTLKTVSRTGMVVTTDLGDVEEIDPKNKQSVGRRLALIALADVYKDCLAADKRDFFYSGPIFQSAEKGEHCIWITFEHAEGGLRTRNDEQTLTGFTICGKDGKFVPAVAKIVGEKVQVSSPEIEDPTEVRFAWNDTAQPNLVNQGLLPASPFRTDEFPLESEGRDF
jgi:sialate O-acetylesterase